MNQVVQTTASTQPDTLPPHSKFARGMAQPALICLLLVAGSLIVFWPIHRFDFLNFDDGDYVTSNPHVQSGLSTKNVVWAFRESHSANWHPLTWISHMLDVELFGKSPAGPHVINLLLHTASTVLLFLLLRRL